MYKVRKTRLITTPVGILSLHALVCSVKRWSEGIKMGDGLSNAYG